MKEFWKRLSNEEKDTLCEIAAMLIIAAVFIASIFILTR
jgi:hypothetical protein